MYGNDNGIPTENNDKSMGLGCIPPALLSVRRSHPDPAHLSLSYIPLLLVYANFYQIVVDGAVKTHNLCILQSFSFS